MADATDFGLGPVIDGRYRESCYLAAFPDVTATVSQGHQPSGLAHYHALGRLEMLRGERPMPDFFKEDEPDLAVSVSGRRCRLDFGGTADTFDQTLYFALFPDIRDAVAAGLFASAFAHWIEFGFGELASGRRRIGFTPPRSGPSPGIRTLRFERLMARPFGVNVFGPFAMESGLGTIARGIVAALEHAGIPLDLWPFDTSHGWQTMPGPTPTPRYRVNLLLVNADTTGHLTQAYPPGTFDDAYTIGVWQWELASMCPNALPVLAGIDEIWTSSRFERDAIAAIAPVPVLVVPPPILMRPTAQAEPWTMPGLEDGRFVFLTMLDMTSRLQRKNTMAAIDAFIELDPPDAVLLVKLHGQDPEAANNTVLQRLAARHPRILLLDQLLTEQEMAGLRARADCLLSPHRSEGFGLNIAEFMALGKPVVATGYSGSTDFFGAEVGYPIEHDLVELPAAVPPYPAGYVWAEPRQASLVSQMRAVLAEPDRRRLLAEAAARRIAENFTAAATGEIIAARLRELGLAAPQPAFMTVAKGGERVGAREPGRAPASQGPVFSLPVLVDDAGAGEAALSALLVQTHGGWELLLRPGPASNPGLAPWLDTVRGASSRLRVLPASGGPGLIEAATGGFVLLVEDAGLLKPGLLAEAAAILRAEPACDGLTAPGLLAVRKSLLLSMGEHDLSPAGALAPAFMARLADRTRLLRRLPTR